MQLFAFDSTLMFPAGVYLGRLTWPDVVITGSIVVVAVHMALVAWRRSRTEDPSERSRRRTVCWMNMPSVLLALTGLASYMLFIPILKTPVLWQHTTAETASQWGAWRDVIKVHLVLMLLAGFVSLASLVVPTRRAWWSYIGLRAFALVSLWLVLSTMMVNIDV